MLINSVSQQPALNRPVASSRMERIHPQVPILWWAQKLFDGTIRFDPSHPEAESLLKSARLLIDDDLVRMYDVLGGGTRSVVVHGGKLAIKRCITGNIAPNVTGIAAAAANLALAYALEQGVYTVGDYRLLGNMPRGHFQPSSIVGKPTWLLDLVPGETAQDAVIPPEEATDRYRAARDEACIKALQDCGIDPTTVFLDSSTPANLMIDIDNKTLTVIDAAAPAPNQMCQH